MKRGKPENSHSFIKYALLLLIFILAGISSCSRAAENKGTETTIQPAEKAAPKTARTAQRFQHEAANPKNEKSAAHLSRKTKSPLATVITAKKAEVTLQKKLIKPKPAEVKPTKGKLPEIDHEPPSLHIFSPENFSIYQSLVKVSGRVGSLDTENNPMDSVKDVKSLSWEIEGTSIGSEIPFNADGTFNFTALTAGFSRTITLSVKAQDKSGNINTERLYLFNDGKGPSLTITSPADNSYYNAAVSVKGKVGNIFDPLDSPDEVSTLTWNIVSTNLKGYSSFDRDGYFSFSLSSAGIPDRAVLHIRASDINGQFTDKYIHLIKDVEGPWIKIVSPKELDYYGDTIEVEGIIRDSKEGTGKTLDVKKYSYSFLNVSSVRGNINFNTDGKFHFEIPTSGLSGTQTLKLTAEDSFGNETVRTVTLLPKPAPVKQIQEARKADASMPKQPAQHLPEQPAQQPAEKSAQRSTHQTAEKPTQQPLKAEQEKPSVNLSKPLLFIQVPKNENHYRTRIKIEGKVGNSEKEPDSITNIELVKYTVSGSEKQGKVKVEKDGNINISFSALGLHGTQVVVVRAVSKAKITTIKSVIVHEDTRGPLLTVDSPGNNTFYNSVLNVKGTVANSTNDPNSTDEVSSVSYRIISKPELSGEIGFDEAGSFNIDIPLEKLSGNQKLIISAKNLNNHASKSEITLFDGNAEPAVKITSPKDDNTYGARLLIEGIIKDPYSNNNYVEKETDITLDIFSAGFSNKPSEPFKKKITPDSNGFFRIVVPTDRFSGSQVVSLAAETWNGKRAETSIRIIQGKSDIPSFMVNAMNGAVKASWEPVPLAADYTVFYTDDGSKPSQFNGYQFSSKEPPILLDNLINGKLYRFVLKALSASLPSLISGIKEAVPLSPYSLLPVVKDEYKQIRIAWNRISKIDRYNIWRSEKQDSGFKEIIHAVPNTVYVDKSVKFGKTYFYKIQPSIDSNIKGAEDHIAESYSNDAIKSIAVSGKTIAFPEKKLEPKLSISISDGQGIAVDGNYAYVADGSGGLKIIDISDPENLVAVGSLKTQDALGIAVKSPYAFLADSSRGIKVVDITEPASPELLGIRKTTNARKIVLKGNYAYVADGIKGLKVIDISSPKSPIRTASIYTPNAQGIALYQNYILLADKEKGLVIIDISSPQNPSIVNTLSMENAFDITIHKDYAFIAQRKRGLKIVDISRPKKPSIIGSYNTDNAEGIAVSGNYAYIADGRGGLKVLDISDPAHSFQFDAVESPDVRAVALSGDYAYLLSPENLKPVQLLIQGNSFEVASCKTSGKAYGVTLTDRFAYVADHKGGLKVIDISRPEKVNNDSVLYSFKTQFAENISVSDNTAYIADGPGGVKIIDISLGLPHLLSEFFIDGHTYKITVENNIAFTASGKAGINVIDVHDVSNPLPVSIFNSQDARDITFQKDILYAADGTGGVKIIDASDPENLRLISAFAIPGAVSISVVGNYIFIAGSKGLYTIDIRDPKNPVQVDLYRTDYAESVTAKGKYIYLSEDYKGIKIFAFSEKKGKLTLVSHCKTVFAISSSVKGNYAYVTDSSGLRIIRILIPQWLIK